MTRVNVVPVQELCDQHLLAEHREIKRIPNLMLSGKLKDLGDIPEEYVLGKGHMKFFLDKMYFLYVRYSDIRDECLKRRFKVQWLWPNYYPPISQDYKPTEQALKLNRQRIKERMPKTPRWTK